jgi:hypothetical protein
LAHFIRRWGSFNLTEIASKKATFQQREMLGIIFLMIFLFSSNGFKSTIRFLDLHVGPTYSILVDLKKISKIHLYFFF